MGDEKDERKRSHLRLVVNNVEKRAPRPAEGGEDFIALEELVAQRDMLRGNFYRDMDPWQAKAYAAIERFLGARQWPYGLDPHHGRLLVLPALVVSP
ncbi:MAG TPA: hypothetical protein VI389_10685, partial [Geobacteraceae bacterium]